MSRISDLEVPEYPRAIALVICDRIIQDQQTNTYSLIDIIKSITVPKLPARTRISLFITLALDAHKYDVFIRLVAPSGKLIMDAGLSTEGGAAGQFDFDFAAQWIPLPEEGDYIVRLFARERVLAERRFVVRIDQRPQVEPADQPIS